MSTQLDLHLPTEAPGCLLRPWRPEDKPALLQHANNYNVWRNLTDLFPYPYTALDADHWLAITSMSSANILLAIEVEGQAAGGIGVIAGDGIRHYTGQFGYWVGESLWGRGIATASARAMAAYALAQPRFVRLEASVLAWNPASMRVLDKTGFVREGISRMSVFKDGQLVDSMLYARIRDT